MILMTSTNKFKLIADEINKEISALIDVTGDARIL